MPLALNKTTNVFKLALFYFHVVISYFVPRETFGSEFLSLNYMRTSMKHTKFYHSIHIELCYTDSTKSSPVSPINFVFIASPSVSFVMTAAKLPHYSVLSSLLSITSLFAFCPHPFTYALPHWQNLKIRISCGTSIYIFIPSQSGSQHFPLQ